MAAGLRSSDAFVLRRCQILLASARGERATAIARQLGFELGLTPHRVSGETIRATLQRLGGCWKRAKRWLTSPDPAYARKKAPATA